MNNLFIIKVTIESVMIIVFRAHDPISFKYISFWYPFLEPREPTFHSNTSVQSREVT